MDNRGVAYGIVAYTLWGFLPLYWRALDEVKASEIIIHRIIWSFVFLAALMAVRQNWGWIRSLQKRRRTMMVLCVSAMFLATNWFIYIWAVNAGFIVETSLGYFINPLVNVFLGTLLLKEILRPGQWLAIGMAGLGVGYLTFSYGALPWIALSLAFSFGLYGLMKKKIGLGSAEGLTAEMSILLLPALAYFIFLLGTGSSNFVSIGPFTTLLLLGSGVVTAVPLLFFGAAARQIPLSMLGLLQYIAPTLQFLIGVLVYKEPFTSEKLIGFLIIWVALALYSLEGLWQRRSNNITLTVD